MQMIYEQTRAIAQEVLEKTSLRPGSLLVVGCSTSEVLGARIGTGGSVEVAQAIYDALCSVLAPAGIRLAAQCCEHLNRCLIVEREVAAALGLSEVSVVPHPHAGGSFGTVAYRSMRDPVAVEFVRADAGIDIGATLIGMHLKHVAVPLKLSVRRLGEAPLTAATTRPKYIGGPRAQYAP